MLLGLGLLCAYFVYQILIPCRRLVACLPPVCQVLQDLGILVVCIGQSECCNRERNKVVGNFESSKTAPLASNAKVKSNFLYPVMILELSHLFLDSLFFFHVGCPVIFTVASGSSTLAVALSCWEWQAECHLNPGTQLLMLISNRSFLLRQSLAVGPKPHQLLQ